MSHVSGLLKLLSRSTGEFDDVFSGFVWVEQGRIVGNITVQRADKFGNRWQIANVAVSPAYRGRGIARRLVERALNHIAASAGRWAVLQVYDHNTVARTLYLNLGFEEIGGQAELRLDRLPEVAPSEPFPNLRPFTAHHWQPLYELASSQLSAQSQWWRAIRRSDFQASVEQQIGEWLWRTLGRQQVYRYAVQSQRRFEGALILTAQRWRGAHKLELWVRPEQYGNLEEPLVRRALTTLQEYPRWPVVCTLSIDHKPALAALQAYGFRIQQTLLTMRHKIEE
jgi:N-acetylglutamate synthase-like GNAT family acetyltransferase